MYSKAEKEVALELYHQCGSPTKTIQKLGYPGRRTLYGWIYEEGKPKKPRKPREYINTVEHPLHPPVEVKLDALHRCFELGESVKLVSEEIGYAKSSIYAWRKKYFREGAVALMNKKSIQRGPLKEGAAGTGGEIEKLKAQLFDLQLENDIQKETINVLKKDPGVDWTALKNREKAVIVDALKNSYSLPLLLKKMKLAKSCYYYQKNILSNMDKYAELRRCIKALFNTNKGRYGYRRIHALLVREGNVVSEKVVRRVMKQENLTVKTRKSRTYRSYKGEISPAVENVLERDFHADKANEKWVTDITEFAIPAGKVYLSPIVDCFDGMLPSWTIGVHPDSILVNTMLDKAIGKLGTDEYPVVHSDRGCHYRWPGWINRMNEAKLTRSMSKKGCSPDNSACEGFFGRLKNEMFYNQDWSGVSIEEFIDTLNAYLIWYNEKRIKKSLGYMSPKEYRQSLGLVA